MAAWRAPDVSARDVEPLGLTESQELPPLSPTTARALSEAFRDDETGGEAEADGKGGDTSGEKGEVKLEVKLEPEAPPPVDNEVCLSPVSSPSPDTMTWAAHNRARRRPEITSMNLSEMKEEVAESAEARRARRSEIEKKSRQRRMGALRRMRREVKQLEDIYSAMLEQQSSTREGYAVPADRHGTPQRLQQIPMTALGDGRSFSVRGSPLERKYSELTLVAHALEENKEKLQKLLLEHKAFQQSITAYPEENAGGNHPATRAADTSGQEPEESPIYDTGVPPSSSWTVPFQKLSIPQCYKVVRDAYDAVRQFDESNAFVTTGASFMGWTDKRIFDEEAGVMSYGFTKQFPLETHAEELFMRMWKTVVDGSSYTKSQFLSAGKMRLETLQKVGDDLQIVRVDLTRPGSPKTFVSLHMDFRVQTPTGFVYVRHDVPSPEFKSTLEPHEHLIDLFMWRHYNQLYDDEGLPAGTEIVVCGTITDTRRLVSERWLFDIALSLLQWESNNISPLFLKFT